MKKLYIFLFLSGLMLQSWSGMAQLGCITRSISSNPNIGTVASPNYLVGIDANNCPVTRPTANYMAARKVPLLVNSTICLPERIRWW